MYFPCRKSSWAIWVHFSSNDVCRIWFPQSLFIFTAHLQGIRLHVQHFKCTKSFGFHQSCEQDDEDNFPMVPVATSGKAHMLTWGYCIHTPCLYPLHHSASTIPFSHLMFSPLQFSKQGNTVKFNRWVEIQSLVTYDCKK